MDHADDVDESLPPSVRRYRAQCRQIRKLLDNGESLESIALAYGFSRATLYRRLSDLRVMTAALKVG